MIIVHQYPSVSEEQKNIGERPIVRAFIKYHANILDTRDVP